MNRTMPCLQMNKLYILGSWSQCIRKNERGLSMNRLFRPRRRSFARPRPRPGGLASRRGTTGTRTKRFMVPMHAKNERGLSMNCDSKTRMTNDETRRNDQIRMTKPASAQLRTIGHSGFGFLWSLVIGHSTTFANPVHDPNACEKTRKGALQEPAIALEPPRRARGPRPVPV